MAVYKMEEWQDACGQWHCNCVSNLANNSGVWWHPARILGLELDEYIKWLMKNYPPSRIHHNESCSVVFYSWDKQANMRKFKNFINAQARKVNYQI